MSFQRPSLSDIIARIVSDIETRLQTGKLLKTSFLYIMAVAYAGAVHSLYGFISWCFRQVFPDTAEAEYMARWASIWSVQRTAATFAAGNVTFTGLDGSVLPEGLRLKRSDGQFYLTTGSAVIISNVATVPALAVNAGTSGNTEAGASLTLVNSVDGVASSLVVAAGGISGGLDSESDDSLLARLLDRIRRPPHGGAVQDYEKWALENNGVTRAWAYGQYLGAGTVGVTFVMDGLPNIIPTPAKVAEVQDYIDAPYRRPATADVLVFAPAPDALNFTIHISPDTPEIRASVKASLEDLVRRSAEPGGTILLSKIREAVSIAAGENDNTVTVPSANVTALAGHIATMGVITWT